MKGPTTGAVAVTFLAAIAGTAVGIGAGWLLFAEGGEQREAPNAAAPTAATASESPANGAPVRTRADARNVTSDTRTQSAIATLAAAHFDFPPLTGAGVIRGTVRSESGAPIAGVEIRALADTPTDWSAEDDASASGEIQIEEILRRDVRAHRWREVSTKTATTKADGAFELTGLADVRWEVSAHAEGLSFTAPLGGTYPARLGTSIGFVAAPSVRFEVDLRLPDRSKPRYARLEWTAPGSDDVVNYDYWNRFHVSEMRPGRWRVSGEGGDDYRLSVPPTDVEVGAGMGPVVLTLKPRPGIVVAASRPDGFADLNLQFFIARAEGADPTDDELRGASHSRSHFGLDGIDRRRVGDRLFYFDLPTGRWIVAAGFDIGPLARRAVTVNEGLVECELAVPEPDASQFVEVHVTGPDGAVPPSARFDWEYRTDSRLTGYRALGSSRGSGVWLVRRANTGVSPDYSRLTEPHDPEEKCSLAVDAAGFARERVAVPPDAGKIDVRLQAPGIAVVRVTGLPPDLNPRALLASIERDDVGYAQAGVRDDGTARLQPVLPGRHAVALYVRWGIRSTALVWERNVDVRAGDNAIDVELPPLYPVDFDLGAAHANARVSVRQTIEDDRAEWIYVYLDSAGRGRRDFLPAGGYRLLVGDDEHDFRVPETRTFKLP